MVNSIYTCSAYYSAANDEAKTCLFSYDFKKNTKDGRGREIV